MYLLILEPLKKFLPTISDKSFVLGHLSNLKKHTIIFLMIIITIVIYFHFSHYLQKQRFLSTTHRNIRHNKLLFYSFYCFNNIVFISRNNAHPKTKNDKCIIFLPYHLHTSWNHTQTTHLIVFSCWWFKWINRLNGWLPLSKLIFIFKSST